MEWDNSIFLDSEDEKSIRTLEEGRDYLEEYLRSNVIVMGIKQIKEDKHLRNEVIQHLRAKTGLSQRIIAILLGINKSAVERIK